MWTPAMSLPDRLIALRKSRGLSQQAMADAVDIHVTQVKRYESGNAQPSIDVLKKIALALNVSADSLLFDEHERGPDEEFRLQFEALKRLTPEERKMAKTLLQGLLMTHDAKQAVDTMRS